MSPTLVLLQQLLAFERDSGDWRTRPEIPLSLMLDRPSFLLLLSAVCQRAREEL